MFIPSKQPFQTTNIDKTILQHLSINKPFDDRTIIFLYIPYLHMNNNPMFILTPTTPFTHNDPQPTLYFCYINILCLPDLILLCILLACSLPIIIHAIRKFWKLFRNDFHNINSVYLLIFAWWVCKHVSYTVYAAKDTFGIILYEYKENYSGTDIIRSQSLSHLSKYYFALDWTSAFAIQSLLIYVPYRWYIFHHIG